MGYCKIRIILIAYFLLMNSTRTQIEKIFNDLKLSDNEVNLIASVLHKIHVKKGTILLKAGDVVEHMYYINSGCMRTYHIDENGKEHTMQFAVENSWISDFTAFFSGSKALLNIEVIHDATIYRLAAKDKLRITQKIPQIQNYINTKLELIYTIMQKRILAKLSRTASEQYIDFITAYPDIEQKVKNYHIASYLGITTESLSRIRKELQNTKFY